MIEPIVLFNGWGGLGVGGGERLNFGGGKKNLVEWLCWGGGEIFPDWGRILNF